MMVDCSRDFNYLQYIKQLSALEQFASNFIEELGRTMEMDHRFKVEKVLKVKLSCKAKLGLQSSI